MNTASSITNYLWIIVQVLLSIGIWLPIILKLIGYFKNKPADKKHTVKEYDYGIIVTAYQQTKLLPGVVDSILKLNYSNYLVYIVCDDCDISALNFADKRVVILKPEVTLGNNILSHQYAITRFKRQHNIITIIDSDNLLHAEYINEMNLFFKRGYKAVQGVRKARNLDTIYARLDEASDIYYRYVDRKLSFEGGSSATLAGSGMAFDADTYKDAIKNIQISGAGFDKLLQYYLVKNKEVLAFSEKAVVLDGKTSKSGQLVKQRARWINAWGKHWALGWDLLVTGTRSFSWNQVAFSNALLRPPLFLLLSGAVVCIAIDLAYQQFMVYYWLITLFVFLFTFLTALQYFGAEKKIYRSLAQAPRFIFFQMLALFKAREANQLSVATKHELK